MALAPFGRKRRDEWMPSEEETLCAAADRRQ